MNIKYLHKTLLAFLLPLAVACQGAGAGEDEAAADVETRAQQGDEGAGEARSEAGGTAEVAETVRVRVPAGATFQVRLDEELSTETSSEGDRFTVTTLRALSADGRTAVPAGATIRGSVTAVQHSEGADRPAVLKVNFEELEHDGETYPIYATLVEANPETESRTSTAEGAAKVGAGAAAGAIVGRIIGGNARGTVIGAAVGAAAGTAIVLGTQDVDAKLPAGSAMTLRLDQPLEVEARR